VIVHVVWIIGGMFHVKHFIAALFITVTFLSTNAYGKTLTVNHQPFAGEVAQRNGKIYANAEDLAKALNLAVQETANTLIIGTLPAAGVSGKVIVNGTVVSNVFLSEKSEWMAELHAFADASGSKLSFNHATQTIDILSPGATALPLQPSPPAATGEFRIYRNPKYGVSLKYPSKWDKFENAFGTLVTFRKAKGENAQDYLENVNLVVGQLPVGEKVSLDEYADMIAENLKKNSPSIQIIDSKPATLSGKPAHENLYQYKFKGNGPDLRRMQVYTLIANRVYVFSYTATPENFDASLPTVQAMLDSLQIR